MSASTIHHPPATIKPLRLPLATAERIAIKIREALELFCERIAIGGSIRRERDEVGDIDLVILPKDQDLMPGALEKLHDRFYKRIRRVSATGRAGRDLINVFEVPSLGGVVQVDLFIARHEAPDLINPDPCNWGSVLMLRTGSVSHNISLIKRAKDRGLEWHLTRGLIEPHTGRVVAATEEADIYKALGLDFIEPRDRERVDF